MIPHQLSTINSFVLSAAHAQPLNVGLPRRKRRSNNNDIDQCGIQRKETACTETPNTDDCTKSTCSRSEHSCEIDHRQKEISFKLESTEPDHTDTSQQHSYYVTILGAVKIELPVKEESMTKL